MRNDIFSKKGGENNSMPPEVKDAIMIKPINLQHHNDQYSLVVFSQVKKPFGAPVEIQISWQGSYPRAARQLQHLRWQSPLPLSRPKMGTSVG